MSETEKTITIASVISVKELSDKLGLPVTKIISILLKNGIMATVNESLDFETAAIIAAEFNFATVLDQKKTSEVQTITSGTMKHRPPVVAVMGHVDHGKTSLLDTIRETNVATGESGGITQHIGAYQVTLKGKKSQHKVNTITFLDTPGHAAFSAMRQHGANITDIVVLVVAANDGVKAQTIEAIDHAKQANVPIIVAVNKIDLPEANIDRVKQQLAEVDLVAEDWGGQTVMVPVSAKTKKGIDNLLEMILLVSDLKDLNAHPDGPASGVVIESHMEAGRGPIATILIQNGTLKLADPVTVGSTFGKIKSIEDYCQEKISAAGPSQPAIISGLKSLPSFGEQLVVTGTEKEAKESAGRYTRDNQFGKVHSLHKSTLDDMIENVEADAGQKNELTVIIKADVKGSLEAVRKVLEDLGTGEVIVKITHAGVGPVTDSDITMAAATKSVVLAFRVAVAPSIRNLAHLNKVVISSYDVIYNLIDDVKAALSKLLPPEVVDVVDGRARIIALFNGDKRGRVVGVAVEDGLIRKGTDFKLMRGEKEISKNTILNVRREKEAVDVARSGQQAGLLVDPTLDVKMDDEIVAFHTETRERSL